MSSRFQVPLATLVINVLPLGPSGSRKMQKYLFPVIARQRGSVPIGRKARQMRARARKLARFFSVVPPGQSALVRNTALMSGTLISDNTGRGCSSFTMQYLHGNRRTIWLKNTYHVVNGDVLPSLSSFGVVVNGLNAALDLPLPVRYLSSVLFVETTVEGACMRVEISRIALQTPSHALVVNVVMISMAICDIPARLEGRGKFA